MTDQPNKPAEGDPQRGPDVTITVDSKTYTVHRGSIIVSDLKKEVGVDSSLVLSIYNGTEFVDLADTERVTLKGGEIFVSHVPRGSSSAC
jgi:hypothetical protein